MSNMLKLSMDVRCWFVAVSVYACVVVGSSMMISISRVVRVCFIGFLTPVGVVKKGRRLAAFL